MKDIKIIFEIRKWSFIFGVLLVNSQTIDVIFHIGIGYERPLSVFTDKKRFFFALDALNLNKDPGSYPRVFLGGRL